MAEQDPLNRESQTTNTDRGLFDCFWKKEEKPMPEAQQHKPEKLPRSNSSSSSSSEEEVEEDGVKIKRKKKKGLTEKIKEKLPGHHKDEPPVVAPAQCAVGGDCVGAGAGEGEGADAAHEHKEKKGILEMIKEKLPGTHKDGDEAKKDH